MRMTTRGLYAIKAILSLVAISEEQKPVSLNKIAQIENLSPEFLQQIFYKLRKAGIIKSSRGPGGGFSLNKKPEEISAYDVLYAVGETLEIVPVPLGEVQRKPAQDSILAMWDLSGKKWKI